MFSINGVLTVSSIIYLLKVLCINLLIFKVMIININVFGHVPPYTYINKVYMFIISLIFPRHMLKNMIGRVNGFVIFTKN